MPNNRDKSRRQEKKDDGFLFIAVVLFLTLCILVLAVAIGRKVFHDRHTVTDEAMDIPALPEIPAPDVSLEDVSEYRVAVIIDDFGWNTDIAGKVMAIDKPITLALLPQAPYSKEIFEMLRDSSRHELILHLPLEPSPPAQSFDRGLITTDMSSEDIAALLDENMKNYVSHIRGLNNHMGSLFTQDRDKMKVLLEEMKQRELFFVDSVTSSRSYGYELALEMGIKTARRDIFLDNRSDPEYIEQRFMQLIEAAKKQGQALGIGHARKNTIEVLERMIPLMDKEGVAIVPVSALLE